MFQSTYFIFIFGTLLFYPILRFGIDLINNFDILLLGVVFLLVFFIGYIFHIFFSREIQQK